MICPQCGKEMKKGKVLTPARTASLFWFPEGYQPGPKTRLDTASEKRRQENGIVSLLEYDLGNDLGLSTYYHNTLTVFLCPDCRIGEFHF